MAKLVVQLVVWNGAKYIPFLFESLRNQTYQDWELVVLDNHSGDNTAAAIKKELINFSFPHVVQLSESNLGFAGGHNKIFKEGRGEYVVLLNQDMYLEKDCFAKLVEFLDEHFTYAAASPRLMKWHFNLAGEDLQKSFSEQIDSLGLEVLRSRRVRDYRAGDEWSQAELDRNPSMDVFGVSGALPIYRRSSLQAIAFSDGTFFDESYHSYKEDVDVAFRLRSAGYNAAVVLDSVAWHDRSAAGPKELTDQAAHQNKKHQSNWVKYHSFKNQLATIYKNEYLTNFILDFPWILWYELKKFIYYLLLERAVLKGFKELKQHRQEYKAKRSHITARRKLGPLDLRQWWNR